MDQRVGQAAVDRLRPLGRRLAGDVEQQRPVHDAVRRRGPEPDQVRHQLEGGTAGPEPVAVAHLAVPEPVGRVGELQRDSDGALGAEASRPPLQQPGRPPLADRLGQVIVQHHVLVVPSELPPGRVEQVGVGDADRAQAADQPVVGPDHGHVHLGDQDMDVLARVAGQGDPFRVAGQVILLA